MGIETMGGAVAKVVMRNSAVPLRATEMFSTSVDGQTSITIKVLQGEREMAADCRELGTFFLRGIPRMPAGIPQVRVEFAIDVSGILSVSAVELRSGKRAAVQIVPNFGLSSEEIERIERESLIHARSDMKRHRLADLLANSSLDLHWINRQFVKHAEKLEPEDRRALGEAIETLRGFVERAKADTAGGLRETEAVDANAFQRAKEALDRASMRLHEISITESLKQGPAIGGGSGHAPA
jgi:molecular chaperone DnaK (HSP70)